MNSILNAPLRGENKMGNMKTSASKLYLDSLESISRYVDSFRIPVINTVSFQQKGVIEWDGFICNSTAR